jgi:putative hydrolase of the HAD superfamily
MIRAICFDLDDTLLDHTAAEHAGATAFNERFSGVIIGGSDFPSRWKAATDAAFARYLAGDIGFTEQRRVRVKSLCSDSPDDREADERFRVYLEAYRNAWRLFDDVSPSLAALEGIPLAIVSNAQSSHQREKLARLGLADRFQAVLTPDVVGVGKPNASIFLAACAALSAEPRECLHVGDHFAYDAIGARDAGMQAAWLDRNEIGSEAPGVRRITTLANLLG